MQIYIPNIRGCSLEPLRALGLGDLLDSGVGCSAIDVLQDGPDGGSGVCFFWADEPNPGMHADDQVWTPAKPDKQLGRPEAAFYLGRAKGSQPGPADLVRAKMLPSCPVTLDDGNQWLVPVAVRLPHKLVLDDAGEPVRRVQPRYERFYQRCEEHLALMRGWRRGEKLVVNGPYAFAVEALAWNYRINRDVADWLELFTEENLAWVVGATFEVAELDAAAAQKKKAE